MKKSASFYLPGAFVLLLLPFCLAGQSKEALLLLTNLQELSSPSMEGRKPGTPGHTRARDFIIEKFKSMEIEPFTKDYVQEFPIRTSTNDLKGKNVLGIIRGKISGAIVVSAHYDHLGKQGNIIYPGADDNASGTAALIYLANYFIENPPEHTVIIAAFDAEESGLLGSKHFVKNLDIDVLYNINLDMIARHHNQEIFACGTAQTPKTIPLITQIDRAYPNIILKRGHDTDRKGEENWTFSSDHGPFYRKGIPFIYFGVEDHEDYHSPSDTFDKIDKIFYIDVVQMIVDFTVLLDKNI